jgi:hypothetical protein
MPAPTDSFELIAQLPTPVPSMPMLQLDVGVRLAQADPALEPDFRQRVSQAAGLFGLDAPPMFKRDRAIVRQDNLSLEVFRASDSLWWTDHRLANIDAPLSAIDLPAEHAARDIADGQLRRLGLDIEPAAISSITYSETEAATASVRATPSGIRSALDVNYTFRIASFPVFGPGAKIKVTLGHAAALAQVVYFWRKCRPVGSFSPITPQQAIERFQQDNAFKQLDLKSAKIVIARVELGFYALPPSKFQRFYIPVYAVDSKCYVGTLPPYSFRRYITARDVSAIEAKQLRMTASAALPAVFG